MTQGTQQATQTILATEQQYKPIDVSVPERAIARNIQEQARKEQERQRRESEGLAMLTEATKGIMPVGAADVSGQYNGLMKEVGEGKIDPRSSEYMRRLMEIKGKANEYKAFSEQYKDQVASLVKNETFVYGLDENGNYTNESDKIVKGFTEWGSTGMVNGEQVDIATANSMIAPLVKEGRNTQQAVTSLNQLSTQLQKIRENNVDESVNLTPEQFLLIKKKTTEGLKPKELEMLVNSISETQGAAIAEGLLAQGKSTVAPDDIKRFITERIGGESESISFLNNQEGIISAKGRESRKTDTSTNVTEGEFTPDAAFLVNETWMEEFTPFLTGKTKEGELIPKGISQGIMKSNLWDKENRKIKQVPVKTIFITKAKNNEPKTFTYDGKDITAERVLQTGKNQFVIVGSYSEGDVSQLGKEGVDKSRTDKYKDVQPYTILVNGKENADIFENLLSGSGKSMQTYTEEWREPKGAEKQAESPKSTTKPTTPKNLPKGAVEISIEDI